MTTPRPPRKRRPLAWDTPQLRALALVFEGRKTLDAIALECAVSARTLDDWIAHPDWDTALQQRRDNLIKSLEHKPYIRKESRLAALSDMAESARREYEARPWLKEIRPTADGEIVNESFNRDAHAAFRDALNDIAKELGERSSNVHVTATQQTFGITLVLERMRSESSLADAAADFVGLVDAAGQAGE